MGHHRKDCCGHRDRVATEHQLHDAVGDIQGCETPCRHHRRRGKLGVNQEVDLANADSEKARKHQARYLANRRVGERDAEGEVHSLPHEGRDLNQKLQDSANENSDGQRGSCILEMMPDDSHRKENGGNVKHDRCGRGQAKNVEAVKDPHGQRREGHKKEVGENNAVQVHSLITSNVRTRKQVNPRRRKHHPQDADERSDQSQRPEQPVGEVPDIFPALLLHVARKNRDEGGGHGAFGDQSTKQVGNAVG